MTEKSCRTVIDVLIRRKRIAWAASRYRITPNTVKDTCRRALRRQKHYCWTVHEMRAAANMLLAEGVTE